MLLADGQLERMRLPRRHFQWPPGSETSSAGTLRGTPASAWDRSVRLGALGVVVAIAVGLPMALGGRSTIRTGSLTVRLASGTRVRMEPGGFAYSAGAAGRVGVWSTGVAFDGASWQTKGVVSSSGLGPVAVRVRHGAPEVLQTVDRRVGVRVWRWWLQTPLLARVSGDGSVGLFDRRTHLLTAISIPPVQVVDRAGRDVTPARAHWQVSTHGRRQLLELRLNDAHLPVPYTIDPIVTREKPTGSGTSGMTVAVPSTIEAGDLIVVHAAVVGGTGVSSISPTISGGGGSFSVLNAQNNNAGTALAQETFWKRAAASDAGATVTVTWSPAANAGAAEVVVEKGVATGGTIPQPSSAGALGSTSNSKVVTCPAISSSAFPQNNMGLCLGAIAIGNTWPASSGSWLNITSKANGTSLSIGSYSDLCGTSGGCNVTATSITTSSSNARGSLGNDFDVPPDTAAPSADAIGVNLGIAPSVQYFNSATSTYYFGVIPASASFTFSATPTDAGSGVDHVAFPNLSGTTGWSSDTGGTVNYQSTGSYTSPTYWITSNPGTPPAANIVATDNNGNNLNSSITFAHDTTAPAPAAPTLTGGYYTNPSVSVTGTDAADSGAGTNTAASTMLRASAALNPDGNCGSFGSFTPISGWTSGTAHSDTSVTSGHCYEYEWQETDKVGNLGTSPASSIAKVIPSSPTLSGATVNGDTLTLVYADSLNLQSTPPAASVYSVQINGGATVTPSNVSISGDAVTLTLANAVGRGAKVFVSYSVPGTNKVQDLAGNTATGLTSVWVANRTGFTGTSLQQPLIFDESEVDHYSSFDPQQLPPASPYFMTSSGANWEQGYYLAPDGRHVALCTSAGSGQMWSTGAPNLPAVTTDMSSSLASQGRDGTNCGSGTWIDGDNFLYDQSLGNFGTESDVVDYTVSTNSAKVLFSVWQEVPYTSNPYASGVGMQLTRGAGGLTYNQATGQLYFAATERCMATGQEGLSAVFSLNPHAITRDAQGRVLLNYLAGATCSNTTPEVNQVVAQTGGQRGVAYTYTPDGTNWGIYVSGDGISPGTEVTPDGPSRSTYSHLAYSPQTSVLSYCYEDVPSSTFALWVGGRAVKDGLDDCNYAWAADETTIAYVGTMSDPGAQLYSRFLHLLNLDWTPGGSYPSGNTAQDYDTGTRISLFYGIAWGAYLQPTIPRSWSYGGSNDAAPGLDPAPDDYTQSSTDASVTSYGPSLNFSRTYDSLLAQSQATAGTPGPLGYGWTDNWGMSLSVNSGTVTINQGDGAVVSFQAPTNGSCSSPYVGSGASGTYCALPEVTGSLTYNSSNSTYTFVTHPYASYTFNSSGQLTSESGPGGATLSLAYNTPAPGSGNCPSSAASCTTITSASGRALVIGSNSSNRVTSVTDPLGRSWNYGYCSPPSSTCSSGDLVSVTDPRGEITSYTYDQGNSNGSLTHDLLTVTKPNAQPGGPDAGDALVNVYNSSGQLTSQTDPAGNNTTYDFSQLDSSDGTGSALTTDADGAKTQDTYSNHALINETAGYGSSSPSTSTSQRDPTTLLEGGATDGNGNATDYGHNSSGLVSSSTDPLGKTTTYSYNAFDEQTCVATAQAAQPCSSLSPPAAISPGGTISPPASAPPAHVTYYEYDTQGNLIWTTAGAYAPGSSQPSEQRTTYNLYSGESVTIGTAHDSCSTTPPGSSLPCATIDPNGVVTQLAYDAAGDLVSSSTPDGNSGGEIATTTYGYDSDGEQTSTTTPRGNLTGAIAGDYTTTTVYNADGQVTSVTVGQPGGTVTPRTTSYGLDDNGNRISVTDARNKTTNTRYDANDEPVLVTDPDGNATLTCYDGVGNVTETVPPVGVAANSLTPSSCPTSYPAGYGDRLAADAATYTYNDLGEKTATTTPAPAGQTGSETTSYAYDNAGQLISTTEPPASNDAGAPNQVTSNSYDVAGQLLSVTTGYGTSAASTTSYCYDPDGNKTASVAPDGNTSGVAACSSTPPFQTSSPYQTGYSYDSLDELISETRPATAAAPSGQTTSYSYDPAGNLLTSQDPNGVTTTNAYTPLNKLATVSYSGSSAHPVSYGYDANGNRVTMSDASGNSSYVYDPFDELSSAQNGAGQTLTYTYNADGQTAGITYPLGAGATWATSDSVGYGYDDAGLLTSITDFNGHTIGIGNTSDGLPNSLTLGASGDTINTTYDNTDNPSQISLGNGSSTLLQFAYTNVPSKAISTEATTPSTPSSPASYTYDAQNRVTQMTPGGGSPLNYGFDASGNLTTLPNGASGSYDHASELTSSVLGGTTTNYTYDSDGQRTQASQAGSAIVTATYNGAQEVSSYRDGAANMSAATYDGNGLRTSSTTTPAGGSATTQSYIWDTSRAMPHLVMDSTNAYIYGLQNGPIEQVKLSDGTITYLVSDRLGSVRGTVNAIGTDTHSTSYDAWGNPQTSDGLTSSTPFGYAGDYTDPTGLNYNLHRYYEPQTGQFISVDPLADQTESPYDYAGQDPINATDPSGQSIWCAKPGTIYQTKKFCHRVGDGSASVCFWVGKVRQGFSCYTGIPVTPKDKKRHIKYQFYATDVPIGGIYGIPAAEDLFTGYRTAKKSWFVEALDQQFIHHHSSTNWCVVGTGLLLLLPDLRGLDPSVADSGIASAACGVPPPRWEG